MFLLIKVLAVLSYNLQLVDLKTGLNLRFILLVARHLLEGLS